MRLITKTIQADADIVLHGDTHEGSLAAHTDGIDRLVKWVMAKPNRYYAHMGDAQEARTIDHPYFDPTTSEMVTPLRQKNCVIERYSDTGDRCLAWLEGNHEFSLRRFGNLSEEVAEKIGAPFGGINCKVRLMDPDGQQIFKLYLSHPFRLTMNSHAKDPEQRAANMKAKLKWFMRDKAADCLVMAVGHVHKLMVVNPVKQLLLTDDGDDVKQSYLEVGDGTSAYIEPDRRWYCSTGSFLKTVLLNADTYSERQGYDPVELGYIMVKIRNGKVAAVERKTDCSGGTR